MEKVLGRHIRSCVTLEQLEMCKKTKRRFWEARGSLFEPDEYELSLCDEVWSKTKELDPFWDED